MLNSFLALAAGPRLLAIEIPDPALEAQIRELMEKPTGEVTAEEMKGIYALKVANCGIRSLRGLEYAENLEILYANNNHIRDLTPLSPLKKIRYLYLDGNEIADFSPILGFSEINLIHLNHNRIREVGDLGNLILLDELHLRGNLISDFTSFLTIPQRPFFGGSRLLLLDLGENELNHLKTPEDESKLFTPATKIYLDDNGISDPTPFRYFFLGANLWDLSNNQITNLDFLPEASTSSRIHLGSIFLGGNPLSDLSRLQNTYSIAELDLSNTQISDLSPLEGTSFGKLNIDNTLVGDISVLADSPSLRVFSARNTPIADITPLTGCTWMQLLYLDGTEITDLSPLGEMYYLEILTLSDTPVESLEGIPFEELQPGLHRLDLSGTLVTDFSSIQSLVQLEVRDRHFEDFTSLTDVNFFWLDVGGCQIGSFEGLEGKSIEQLDLSGADIADWSGFIEIQKLRRLIMAGSVIDDLSILSELPEISSGLALDLSGSQIKDFSRLSAITQLSYLDLSETGICDLSVLSDLKELSTLNLRNNAIVDLSALESLEQLTDTTYNGYDFQTGLDVSGNFINLSPESEQRAILDRLNSRRYLAVRSEGQRPKPTLSTGPALTLCGAGTDTPSVRATIFPPPTTTGLFEQSTDGTTWTPFSPKKQTTSTSDPLIVEVPLNSPSVLVRYRQSPVIIIEPPDL